MKDFSEHVRSAVGRQASASDIQRVIDVGGRACRPTADAQRAMDVGAAHRGSRTAISRKFFETDPLTCARSMIGCELRWGRAAGIIVETEAYAEFGDEASHTFFRKSMPEFVRTRKPGTLYVYLNYGMHWLLNFLVKSSHSNGFVLVRALEPTAGVDLMFERRGVGEIRALCSGPGKLTQALAIDGACNGVDFFELADVELFPRKETADVETDRRIGINRSAEFDWRFLLVASKFVSARKKTRPRGN
jgi:DNA-3-methyladenine glycosylase